MLAEAKREAERIVKEARERQERLVGERGGHQAGRARRRGHRRGRAGARAGDPPRRRGLRRRDPQHARGQPVEVHRRRAARPRAPAGQGRAGRSRLAPFAARCRRAQALGWSARETPARLRHAARRARTVVLARAGVVAASSGPTSSCASALAMLRWGPTPRPATRISAPIRTPDRAGDRRRARDAHLRASSTGAPTRSRAGCASSASASGDAIAIMCRNHRGFIEATVACVEARRDALLLNTAFAGPQIADVLRRERPGARDLRRGVRGARRRRARGPQRASSPGSDPGRAPAAPDARGADRGGLDAALPPPVETRRVVILTSGTTGHAEGRLAHAAATRSTRRRRCSRRSRCRRARTTMIAAPLFHSWGYAHFTLGLGAVLDARAAPRASIRRRRSAPIAQHRASALVVVPVMLQRILELGAETLARYDTSSLQVIAVSGSALPGELAHARDGRVRRRALQPLRLDRGRVGDDRHAGGPARRAGHGRARRRMGTRREAARRRRTRGRRPGDSGRIFVGNEMVFDGYTGGGGKDDDRRPDERPATSATSTPTGGCSSTAATTT